MINHRLSLEQLCRKGGIYVAQQIAPATYAIFRDDRIISKIIRFRRTINHGIKSHSKIHITRILEIYNENIRQNIFYRVSIGTTLIFSLLFSSLYIVSQLVTRWSLGLQLFFNHNTMSQFQHIHK